jgi:hypothetical protein
MLPEGLGKLEKINLPYRVSNLPSCSVVPQETTLPRVSRSYKGTRQIIGSMQI